MNDVIFASSGTLEQIEKQVILIRYKSLRENKTQTAQSLGIAIRTLDAKLERYKEDDERNKSRDAANDEQRARELARYRGQPYVSHGDVKPLDEWQRLDIAAQRKRDEEREKALYADFEREGTL